MKWTISLNQLALNLVISMLRFVNQSKVCSECKQDKPLAAYSKNGSGSLRKVCKSCRSNSYNRYNQTKVGLFKRLYQRISFKKGFVSKLTYEEYEKYFNRYSFLFEKWVESGKVKRLKPSIKSKLDGNYSSVDFTIQSRCRSK